MSPSSSSSCTSFSPPPSSRRYYFGPGPLYHQPFYNDRGIGVGQCDDITCGPGEADIGEYKYVDNCLGGGGGCIGLTSGCRTCSINNYGTYPKQGRGRRRRL